MLVMLALALASAASPAPVDTGATIDRWLTAAGFRGNVLVAKGDQIVTRRGFGLADRENGLPYDADTVFTIGSITKQFTAAAILKLEMQGKLRVEDPVAKFFPGVPEDKKAITLHQLLTHTSGLDSDFAKDFDPVGRDEYVKRILASTLRTKPGEAYFYANSGYSLLGAIVEIASGRPYEQYLRDNLFLPAGMKDTGYKLPKWDPKRIAVGYRDGERWGKLNEKPWAPDGPYWALRANGGILSTLDDMRRWHLALLGDAVLSKAERDKMFARQVREGPGADSFYGYGWSIEDSPWGGNLIGHNGGNTVFYAEILRYPDENLVVILSTNDSTVHGGPIAHALARMAHGESVPVPSRAGASVRPLGTTGRDAVVRAWIDAFNAPDFTAMHALRAAQGTAQAGASEAERDQRIQKMRDDIGKLEPQGVVEESSEVTAIRATGSKGPAATLRFQFDAAGKLQGIGVQLGD